jgi:hypothetical protein
MRNRIERRFAISKIALLGLAMVALVVPGVAGADGTPANDSFASAQVLSGTNGSVSGSNVGATSEAGEPVIAAELSVWYSWTAPASGPATFDMQGSNFDTVIAAYTGTSVNGLSLVAQNDDYYLLQSRIDFEATAGTTYYIQVDGFPDVSNSGSIVLNWQLGTAPPPAPSIDSSPAAVSTSSTFAFSDLVTEVTFLCSIDSSPLSACISPKTYTGLGEGLHTFLVAARNTTGQTSSATAYTWTIDSAPPPQPTLGSHPQAATNSAGASFTFADTEAMATFLCSLDGSTYATCADRVSYTDLSEGAHRFAVEARDTAGNIGTPATFDWVIDLTPPVAASISSAPPTLTNSSSASFSFAGGERGLGFSCSLDGAADTDCTSPRTYSSLSEGAHTLAVKAKDAVGNVGPATTFTWTIDLTPPPAPTLLTHPDAVTTAHSVAFTFTDSEEDAGFRCSLDGASYTGCTSPKSYSSLAVGSHTFMVYVVDVAGNLSTSVAFSWADPRGAARNALAMLQSLPGGGTDNRSNNVREAIKSLQDALDGSLWYGGSYLQARGERVFRKVKESVTKLVSMPGDSRTQLDKTQVQNAIDSLVAGCKVLAKAAIDEGAGPPAYRLVPAQTELDAGSASAAKGKPVDAIEHYKRAWQRASCHKGAPGRRAA